MLGRPAMKAIGKYEDVGNQVMEGHKRTRQHAGQVLGNLKKASVNIRRYLIFISAYYIRGG